MCVRVLLTLQFYRCTNMMEIYSVYLLLKKPNQKNYNTNNDNNIINHSKIQFNYVDVDDT